MILEPLYMLNNLDICNKVYNINIYGNVNVENEKINVHKIDNIGDYCLITWYEDKAVKTGIDNFSPSEKIEAIKFVESTKNEIESDGFKDLGYINVGLFDNKPIYRWIDVQPK
jgi:hypothetical protein